MKKQVIIILLIVWTVVGCTKVESSFKTNDNNVTVELKSDYIFFPLDNCCLVSKGHLSINCPVYSSVPIRTVELIDSPEDSFLIKSMWITLEQVWKELGIQSEEEAEKLGISKDEKVTLPFYLYQTLMGKNWKKYADLQFEYSKTVSKSNATDEHELVSQLFAEQNEYLQEYQKRLENNDLPQLYHYEILLDITLKTDEEPSELTELSFLINGKKHSFSTGSIILEPEDVNESVQNDQPLVELIIGAAQLSPVSNGENYQIGGPEQFYLLALEPVEILSIKPLFESMSVNTINLTTFSTNERSLSSIDYDALLNYSDQAAMDFFWNEKSPFLLNAGQLMTFTISGKVPNLEGALYGRTNQILEIKYRDMKGNIYTTQESYEIRRDGDPFEAYYMRYNDLDVLSYYRDYYDPLNASEHGIVLVDSIGRQ